MSDILFSTKKGDVGSVGFITLNRTKALNALTFEMINLMYERLVDWQSNTEIKCVVVCSNSTKAFCAGGDVVKLHEINKTAPNKALDFFKNEYILNCLIRNYTKPYICLLDGLTIGGGVGISLHGSYPIASENFSFSMPETGIGFFPDVGGGYLLSRCKGALGLYLGLTGKKINAEEAIFAGLLTYQINAKDIDGFIHRLLTLDLSQKLTQNLKLLINSYVYHKSEVSLFNNHIDDINYVFSGASIKDIFSRLCELDNDWSNKTNKILKSKSPTALLITFEQLRKVQNLSMEDTMKIEYRMAAKFLENNDFKEGVRALLVDKDLKPCWQEVNLNAHDPKMIENYFSPLEKDLFYHLDNKS